MRLLFRIGLVISVVLGSLVSAFWLTSNDVAFALTHFRHSAWALPLVVSATPSMSCTSHSSRPG
ncbi:MAG: hypothetical protein NTZ05_15140, partial [Chloroflexi bacterium]|nr:hypothetical protein [Chloroflexota bacterium]